MDHRKFKPSGKEVATFQIGNHKLKFDPKDMPEGAEVTLNVEDAKLSLEVDGKVISACKRITYRPDQG